MRTRIESMWKRVSDKHNKDVEGYKQKEHPVNYSKGTASRKESSNRIIN